MNPESFKKKLYIPRDLEGETNTKELSFLHKLEKEISDKFPSFVSLAPFGSAVTGYKTETSDLDVHALYDFPRVGMFAERGENEYVRHLRANADKIAAEEKIEMHFLPVNISPDKLRYLQEDTDKNNESLGILFAFLTRMNTGQKINEYRKNFLAWLNEQSIERKEKIKKEMIRYFSKMDSLGLPKKKDRLSNISEAELSEISTKRLEMWRKHIKEIWSLE